MLELELLGLQEKLERDSLPYVLATVIAVHGSASAKTGSKMLISPKGENLWGWVGGGCAESFTCSQACEALEEGRPRIIDVDLDDEVFGLGMPCGGKMEIFLEPRLNPELLRFPFPTSPSLQQLAQHFGFRPQFSDGSPSALSPADCIEALAHALAKARGLLPLRSLAENSGARAPLPQPAEFLVLGHSRITEELAKLGTLLKWPTRVYGLGLQPGRYPTQVQTESAQGDYAGLCVKQNSFVVVASHHKGDHHYLAQAIVSGAAYIGLVASRSRCQLVFEHLRATGNSLQNLAQVHAPTGFDLGCRNPGEIALSIVAEMLFLQAE